MKIAKVKIYAIGGLGNQLFAYAFAQAIVDLKKIKVEISDRYIKYGSNTSRVLVLNKLANKNDDISFILQSKKVQKFISKNELIKKIVWRVFSIKKIYAEKDLQECKVKPKSNIQFRDYFQNWVYADSVGIEHFMNLFKNRSKSEILKQLNLEMEIKQPVSVHLRIGDYLDFPEIYKIVPQKYFLEALKKLQAEEKKEVWIFCENKDELNTFYPEIRRLSTKIIDRGYGISDLDTFEVLSNSKYLVTTNSTFSLWAGWIASNNNSVVYSYKEGEGDHISNYHKWNRYSSTTNSFENSISEPKHKIALERIFQVFQ